MMLSLSIPSLFSSPHPYPPLSILPPPSLLSFGVVSSPKLALIHGASFRARTLSFSPDLSPLELMR